MTTIAENLLLYFSSNEVGVLIFIFAHGRDTSRDKLEKRERKVQHEATMQLSTRLDQILRLPVYPQRSKTTNQNWKSFVMGFFEPSDE